MIGVDEIAVKDKGDQEIMAVEATRKNQQWRLRIKLAIKVGINLDLAMVGKGSRKKLA